MAVTNSRPVDTVVNRCRPTDEGDILVPHETTAILGTTDRPVDDPEEFEETRAEIDLLVDEIGEMVPEVEESRLIRSYWGVRPLYDPTANGESGEVGDNAADPSDGSRDFAVLDHGSRDGLAGLTTVLGGKLTTYRLMAEQTSDLVAEKLDLDTECRTTTEPLPGSRGSVDFREVMAEYELKSPIASRSADRLGDRTEEVLESGGSNPVVCECEAVTAAEIQDAIAAVGPDLGAVRMRTRATMGTCQGGFCSHRLAVMLAEPSGISTAWRELESLVRERWKGQRLVLEGDHLAQAALNHAVRHLSLNVPDGISSTELSSLEEFDSGGDETRASGTEFRSGGSDSQ
jgi:glycerol-3-phosphate dehydrogenase